MQVEGIFQDSRGYIWIGTRGGLSRFNGETFENILLKDGLPSQYVIRIDEDSQGNIWIGCGKGIAKYDGQQLEIFPIDTISLRDMAVDDKDRVWFTDNHKQLLVLEGGLIKPFPLEQHQKPIMLHFNDVEKRLYISFYGKGIA